MSRGDADDPKNLIYEAFRIEGITQGECRSIFLDWALSLGVDIPPREAITRLIARHSPTAPTEHPMLQVLIEGRGAATSTGRRGGRAARLMR